MKRKRSSGTKAGGDRNQGKEKKSGEAKEGLLILAAVQHFYGGTKEGFLPELFGEGEHQLEGISFKGSTEAHAVTETVRKKDPRSRASSYWRRPEQRKEEQCYSSYCLG